MPLDLRLGNVNQPGSVVRPQQVTPGAGLVNLGRSLDQAGQALKQLESAEDDLLGLQLFRQYTQTLDQRLHDYDQSKPHTLKKRQGIFDIVSKTQDEFIQLAAKGNAGKAFAQRAGNYTLARQDKALTALSGEYNQFGLNNIKKSELITQQSLVDPQTGTIPTFTVERLELDGSRSITAHLTDPELMASKIKAHFDTVTNNLPFLANQQQANERVQVFAQELMDTVLESIARNKPLIFKRPNFKSSTLKVEVLQNDPVTGQSSVMTYTPTLTQREKMQQAAKKQAADTLLDQENRRKAQKRLHETEDNLTLLDAVGEAIHPRATPSSREALFQHLSGNTNEYKPLTEDTSIRITFHDKAKQAEARDKVMAIMASGGPPIENNDEYTQEIHSRLWARLPVSINDMYTLKWFADEKTYNRLWERFEKNQDRAITALDTARREGISSIKQLLGELPGRTFNKNIGVVTSKVIETFKAEVDAMGDGVTPEKIEKARFNALLDAIDFVATAHLNKNALRAISQFNGYIDKDTGLKVTGADQIMRAYHDPNNRLITTERQKDNALLYYYIKERALARGGGLDDTLGNPPSQDIELQKARQQQLDRIKQRGKQR